MWKEGLNMKFLIITLLITSIVIISGCSGSSTFSNSMNLKEITQNFEEYQYQNITLSGEVRQILGYGSGCNYKLIDNEGYSIIICVSQNRDFIDGEKYTITGILDNQKAYGFGDTFWFISVK